MIETEVIEARKKHSEATWRILEEPRPLLGDGGYRDYKSFHYSGPEE